MNYVKKIFLLVAMLSVLGLILEHDWYIALAPMWIILLIGIGFFIVQFFKQYKINYETTRKEKEEKS